MKITNWIWAAVILIAGQLSLSAQSLDAIYQNLVSLDSQRQTLRRDYDREKASNEERMLRSQKAREQGNVRQAEKEVQEAYSAAGRLEKINERLNELEKQRTELCKHWISIYGTTIDRLLVDAEKETNRKKRAEIGTLLQKYQAANSGLCNQMSSSIPVEWRNLQIESYDGPAEIKQKVQLLQEISREMMIGVARLDTQYQEALRERRTRDRAQEFVQEGTLFDNNLTLRSRGSAETANGPDGNPITPGGENTFGTASTPSSDITMQPTTDPLWQGRETAEQIEADYKKRRNDMQQQQKALLQKIQEFEKVAETLLKP